MNNAPKAGGGSPAPRLDPSKYPPEIRVNLEFQSPSEPDPPLKAWAEQDAPLDQAPDLGCLDQESEPPDPAPDQNDEPEPERWQTVATMSRPEDEGVTAVYLDTTTNRHWLDRCDGSPRVRVEIMHNRDWREVETGVIHDHIDGSRTLPTDNEHGEPLPDWEEPSPLPDRGDMGTAPVFPLEHLPPSLQSAAREVARFVKVPVASPALVGIGAAATAIGKRALVVEREGLTHHPALCLVGIAQTGERKSPVFRLMSHALEAWAETQESRWEDEARRAKSRNHAVDAEIKAVKGRKDLSLEQREREIESLEAERLPFPPRPKLFTTDATEERVFQMMHERGGAFAVMSGEGRPVLDSLMGKYSGKDRTGDAIYLAGISGDTISRDRVGNAETGPEDRVIRRPCLNVCVLVQPDKYLEAAGHPALRASGALARIWPVWLPSMAGHQHEEPGERGLSNPRMEPFHRLIEAILTHEIKTDQDGRPRPHVARLSPGATEARRVFHNRIQDLMPDGGDLSDCRDIAAKAVSQTAKLALVLHLTENPEALEEPASEISEQTWASAQAIGTYFLTEAVRVQRCAAEDPALEGARRVLAWIAKERLVSLTARDCSTLSPRPRPSYKDAVSILDVLEDQGYLRSEIPPGKRKPVYLVNPIWNSERSQ